MKLGLWKFASTVVAAALILSGPASAAGNDNTQTTVEIVQPALSLEINETTLHFGDAAGITSQNTYDSYTSAPGVGLSVTVNDSATANQATTGWVVSAQASDLTGTNGTIPASGFSFGGDPGMATFTWNSGGPAGTGVSMEAPFDSFPSPLDTEQPIFGAAADQGKGNWTADFAPNAFQLFVPGSTAAGTYTGTLTLTVARRL